MRVIKLLNWDYTENWTNYQNIYRLYKVASYHSHSQIYMVHWIHIKFHTVRCFDFSSWRPITKRGAHDSKSWPSNLTSVFDNKGFFELWQSTSMPNGIHSKVIRSEPSGKRHRIWIWWMIAWICVYIGQKLPRWCARTSVLVNTWLPSLAVQSKLNPNQPTNWAKKHSFYTAADLAIQIISVCDIPSSYCKIVFNPNYNIIQGGELSKTAITCNNLYEEYLEWVSG